MNDVFENIYLRRSVRKYKLDDVPDDIIKEFIRAGTYAPFSVTESRRFVVIKNREMIGRLSKRAKKLWLDSMDESDPVTQKLGIKNMLESPAFDIFYNAPVLILIYATPDARAPQYDCATAAQNMMLAARSLDIGSCWIGLGMPLDSDADTRQELNVPEGYRLMTPLIFGYPATDVQTAPPRDGDVILSWIR